MKKKLLITLGLLFLFNLIVNASNRYWVGGTGVWHDQSHWSAISGGSGGATIPTSIDDVFFDENSFSESKQTVMFTENGACHNLDWSTINKKAIFSSSANRKLYVSGSYTLSSLLLNGFKGTTIFNSTSENNIITSAGVSIIGDIVFEGTGSWTLNDDFNGKTVTIKHLKGTLNTNDKSVVCNNFVGNSNYSRILNLGNSEITIQNRWDFSSATNITLNASSSRIVFDQSVDSNNFKGGNLSYGSVSAMAACSGNPCANFTITLTQDSVTCQGLCDGAAHAVITGGSGNFTYDWAGTASPTGDGTPNITAMCTGSVSIKVTDNVLGTFCICFITIREPDQLIVYELTTTPPLCNGQCNGKSKVAFAGGTTPIDFLWTGGLGTNDSAVNVCAGTYNVTATDWHGCVATTTIVVNQPNTLVAPGVSSMVTCNGFNNGTATINPTGGTGTYTYNWTPGNPTGDGTESVTNLSPGTYTATVTDANLCTATYTTTITQPAVLTLAVSKINATCGGLCNGSITATVSGGTTPYTYAWSNGATTTTASTTNTISALCAGSYNITVTDAKGCTKTISAITITEPAVLSASAAGVNTSCFGVCNGTGTLTITGGTAAYTIVWVPAPPVGQGTVNISQLCPGTYTANITDLNNCTTTASITITEPALLVANPTATNPLCFGVCNGTATSNPTGGTAPYTYSWTGPAPFPVTTTQSISNLCPGTYTIKVTDSKGCISTQSVVIPPPTTIVPNATSVNVSCNGACNGTAESNPTGGTGPYTYSWTGPAPFGGSTSQNITGLCPGVYTVTVTDANLCTKTQSVTITQPNILNVTLNATVLACNGDCNSTITSTVSGGSPPYTFVWSNGGSGSSITNQCAGTHTLTVTDARGCVKVTTITVNQPTILTAVSNSIDVTCFGVCNGAASVIAGGGTPGYTYLWLPGGQTTSSITNQCAGTYTIRVRDLNGCTVTNTVVINQPLQLSVSPSIASPITCSGACNGSLTATITGGNAPYTSDWLPGNYTGEPGITVTNICAGTFTFQTTDSKGCTASAPISITQPPAIAVPITGSTSSCNVCTGTATVSPSGGTAPYTYLWSTNAGSQTTQTATGLCPNVTYTVTVTDSKNCTAVNTVTISQMIAITITTSNTTLSCVGACDGIATANAAGGLAPYSFQWNKVPGNTFVANTQTVSNLCAGTYEVLVADSNGCLNRDSVTFTNPPALTVTTTRTNLTCGGTCTGSATVTPAGGTGLYTFSWLPGGQTTQTATGLCLGTYTVTVTDSSGCTIIDSVVFSQPTIIVDNPTFVDANCTQSNGSISVAPIGGTPATVGPAYTFLWTGPVGFIGQGTSSITNLIAGAYNLTITDSVGCQFNFNYLLSNINGPLVTMAQTDVSCNNLCDGTATATVSGGTPGYTFDWTPNAAGDGTNAITGLCGTTTYTVMVTDLVGCITFDSSRVVNPLIITPNQIVVNESCGGACDGRITLNPSGGTPGATGYTYSWSGGLPATATQSNLCAGLYTATIMDSKGCTVTVTINIVAPPMLTVTLASTNVKCSSACNGTATATPNGGSGLGYTYTWSPSVGVLANVVNLCPGQYIVTVKDGNNCTAKDTVIIAEPLPLLSSTSQINTSCFGVCDGVAMVATTGGTTPYSYNWMPGGINNDTASGLCAGPYNVVVTDANLCISTPSPITITQPAAIASNVTSTNAKCNGSCDGTAVSSPTGGTGVYTYNWMPGNPTGDGTSSVSGLCGGTYTITVSDGAGCSITDNFTLVDPAVLIANTSSISPTCRNGCNGSVTAAPVGGTPGYTYSWSPGSVSAQTVNNLCPSVYTVIVTDLNLCKDTQSVILVNPPSIDIVVSSTPAACGFCDGTISITPVTGTPNFTYNWTLNGVSPPSPFSGQGTANATAVCAGLYSVLVTDANSCDSTFLIPLNNASGPTGETVTTVDVTCNGLCNGSGTVTPIGGVPPYDFLWNNPNADSTATALGLCAGSYLIEVSDSNTCIHFSPVTINQPNPIISNAMITSAVCSNICTGAISLTPSGGTGAFSNYVWSPGNPTGQNTSSVSNLCSGTYTVTYNDANLCPKVDSFTVTQSTPLVATIASTNISCSSVCNGTAYVTITSGTAPFTIQWNDPSGQTNDTASALCAGTYSVQITDALGCITIISTTITATPPVVVNATVTNASCGICDGSALAVPSGGTSPFTYLWSNGQVTANATNLCAGLYTVDITDSAGCISNFGITVSNVNGPTSLAITSTNAACFGSCNGTVTGITPSGGTAPYSYLWISGGQTTPTLNNLCSGTYYVQVTDALGCSIIDSVSITEPSAITANQIITAPTCGMCDGSIEITPTGCTGPFTILWNTGFNSSPLTNLCAGVYSVQLTCNASGCTQNIVIPLNSQGGPTLAVTSANVTCNGVCNGTATVADQSTGTSSFLWNDVNLQTTATATSLCAGSYFVQGTDNNGCISIAPVIITEPTPIGFSVANTIDPLCNGDLNGSITVIPSGGTLPYSYVWSPAPAAGQTTATASGLSANTYNVTVTDANGCSGAPQTITISQTSALTISSVFTNPSCNTIADGSVDVTVTGGALPYIYQWSGMVSATTEDLTNVLSGSDTILVTDNNGCTILDTITLVPNQTVIAVAGNDTSFCQSGALTLSATASIGGVNYQWFDMTNVLIGSSSALTFNPPTGTNSYYVTVDNGTGCMDSDTIIVTSNVLPVANAGSDVIIVVGASTAIGGNPTGPSGATFAWMPLPGLDNSTFANPVATPASTTTYTVSVSSAQGCISTDVVTVTVLPTIVIPDGISPNADGDNDEWLLDGIELFPDCVVEVYNRWGELLFQSKGYKEHWKGVFKGKPLPVGTYYYIIDLKDPLFPDVYTGPITILR